MICFGLTALGTSIAPPADRRSTRPAWLAHSFGHRPHFGSRRAGLGRATGASTTTLTRTLGTCRRGL